MIGLIRKYVDEQINSLDRKYVPHREANTNEGIGASKYEKTYWIEFIANASSYEDVTYNDVTNVNLEIAQKGGRDPIKAHDEIWCFALKLKSVLINNEDDKFTSVRVQSIAPISLDRNMNTTKLGLNIDFRIDYSL